MREKGQDRMNRGDSHAFKTNATCHPFKRKKCKSRQKREWKAGEDVGRRREEGKEGVVVSCNKFNLNPKLTRCRDCRVLKI